MNTAIIEADNLEAMAVQSEVAEISKKWGELKTISRSICDEKIQMVNIGREIGLLFQLACKHEQMRLSFFENIKQALPPELTFIKAQKCMKLARAYPNPITTFEEAQQAEQLTLQASGEVEISHRDGPQQSRELLPVPFLFDIYATVKEKVEKRRAELEQCNGPTRAECKSIMGKIADYFNKTRERL